MRKPSPVLRGALLGVLFATLIGLIPFSGGPLRWKVALGHLAVGLLVVCWLWRKTIPRPAGPSS